MQRALAEQELILDNATVGIAFLRKPHHPALQPLLRGNDGRRARRAGRAETPRCCSRARRNGSAPESRATRPGPARSSKARRASERRRDGSTFICRVRGRRDRRRRRRAGVDLELRGRDRRAPRPTRASKAALDEQELILRNATIGIAFVRNRIYQRCSARLEEMFGYASGEMLGLSTEACSAPRSEFEDDAEGYKQLAAGESVSIERQYKRKDGSVFWVQGRRPGDRRAATATTARSGSTTTSPPSTTAREALEASRGELGARGRRAVQRSWRRRKRRAQHLADHDALTRTAEPAPAGRPPDAGARALAAQPRAHRW